MLFITSHWAQISTILWLSSELLGEVESIKSNSVFGLGKSLLKTLLGK